MLSVFYVLSRLAKDNIFCDCDNNLVENRIDLGGDVVGAIIPFLTDFIC